MAEAAPRFCVLGRGVAGLSTAYFLQRSFPRARISVVGHARDEADRPSSRRTRRGQVYETGFRASVLNDKNGRELLGLLKLLKLDEEAVSANIEASARRHLFHRGRVQLFPRVPHILGFGPALVAEPVWPRGRAEDESVHAFVARRSSRAVADRIADPICWGLLGGGARELSVRTCFPRLWFNERRFRSVFVGSALSTLLACRQRSWLALDFFDPLLQRVSAGGRCFTLREGLGSLVTRLEEVVQHPPEGTRPVELRHGSAAISLRALDDGPSLGAEVALSGGQTLRTDAVVAAMLPRDLAQLLDASGLDTPMPAGAVGGSACGLLRGVTGRSVAVVNVGFDREVLRGRFRGAGYFVGSLEKQEILGSCWNSHLFPGHGNVQATHLTVYVRDEFAGSEATAEEVALRAVRDHLGILDEPEEVHTTCWPQALPQYAVGHRQALCGFNAARLRSLPWLHVTGAGYFGTRGVADEIVDARELADSLHRRFARFPGLVENETEEDFTRRFGSGFDAD